jgi:Fe-S oxidoreductase
MAGEMPEQSGTLFAAALETRIEHILDACTACGKCVEACPVTEPAGVGDAPPGEVVTGVLDILKTGQGPDAAVNWAQGCCLTGACIKACDYGVNPRFMLAMARQALNRQRLGSAVVRKKGIAAFNGLSRSVRTLARLQLPRDMLARLGQLDEHEPPDPRPPDFVLYTGCNVLKTPHIALLSLDILDALGARYKVLGGPHHCCGILYHRTGDKQLAGRMGLATLDKFRATGTDKVVAWCGSCHTQFTETILPTAEIAQRNTPLDMTPYLHFLVERKADLAALLKTPVNKKVALHKHPGVAGVVEAAETLLAMVPGLELIDLGQPQVGLMSNYVEVLPDYRRQLHLAELDAAQDAGIDALAAVYHSDHRELCAHEGARPFEIVNLLDLLGASMGLGRPDRYKSLKLMQDVDTIMAECTDLIAEHGLDAAAIRPIVEAMLADQPLPVGTQQV